MTTSIPNCKRICLGLSMLLCCSVLVGCNTKKDNEVQNDVLSLKETQKGRTQISVLVKHAFSINNFEKAVEEKFPDIDIVQVGNFTANTVLAKEFKARLEHDDLTDIVMTWPLDVGKEYWSERLIDLSGMSFTSQYNSPSLNSIAEDGKLYFLPGPAQMRGIVYNKTMFKENGWKVPKNYNEFSALCKKIESTGMRAFQLSLGNSEVFDTAFTGFNFTDSFSTPKDGQWVANYNEGIGKFTDHFSSALDQFQTLIDDKIIQKSDMQLHYQDTQLNLLTRKTAMIEDSVQMIQRGKDIASTDDEFALMPFFSPGENGDWVRTTMVCYVGLNKHLEDADQEDKYEKVLKIMEYISTKDGQTALASDTGGMLFSLKGMLAPDIPQIQDIKATLQHGQYAEFPVLKNIQDKLRGGLAGMLSGTLNKEQVAKSLDQISAVIAEPEPLKLGEASSDFTMIDTGSFVCDAMRQAAGSEIALFMDNGKDGLTNGKGVGARLYKGDVTSEDIDRIYPDIRHGEKGELLKIEMSGENLIKTLEYSIKVDNQTGWFYYFSGLKMEFDPIAKQGKRIHKITLENGKDIEEDKLYSIAVMDDTVSEEFIRSNKKTGLLIKDVISDQVVKNKTITPANDQRFILK